MYDIQIFEVKEKKELCTYFNVNLMLIVGLHHINVECLAPNSVNKFEGRTKCRPSFCLDLR